MDLLIADTFTASLARLTNEEQKAVKTTAFDLQLNPSNPGMSVHKLDRARDKRFWSVRVSSDLRLILHRTESTLMLCYVDHHDPAYHWAERRKLETHPTTGAAQLSRSVSVSRRSPFCTTSRLRYRPSRRSSPVCRTTCSSATASRPSGWPMRARPTKTASWSWWITFRRRRPRRCWSWPRAASRSRLPRKGRTPSPIPIRCAASV